jgi:hypothetical protein
MADRALIVSSEQVERRIMLVRGQKVMLDSDLAALYAVQTGQLVRAVKRNADRFPADFAFQLTRKEFTDLKCQIGISSQWGGRRTPPYAFTEQGVAMLSSVLRSKRAVRVNIEIMRTFVRLRCILAEHKELAKALKEMEGKYDAQFRVVFDILDKLTAPAAGPKRRRMGFPIPKLKEG